MRTSDHQGPSRRPFILGAVGVSCGLLGIFSWIEYGAYAMRSINAVISRDSVMADKMASYADGFSLAQLLFGVLAVGLGWTANARGRGSPLARRLGVSAVCLGVVALVLLMVLV